MLPVDPVIFRYFDNYRIDEGGAETILGLGRKFCEPGQDVAGLDQVFPEALEICLKNIALREIADELPFSHFLYQARGLEFLHVVGEGGGADLEAFQHSTTSERLFVVSQTPEDFVAARIGERFGDQLDLIARKALLFLTQTSLSLSSDF